MGFSQLIIREIKYQTRSECIKKDIKYINCKSNMVCMMIPRGEQNNPRRCFITRIY